MSKEKANKIRKWLLIVWLAYGAVLFIFIQYAGVHIEVQPLADKFVKGYFWGTPVVIAIMQWLRRKK